MSAPACEPENESFLRPDWPAPPQIHAACTTRLGGVSLPPYDSLNIGRSTVDDSAAVDENRRRMRQALNLPAEPLWLRQVHGHRIVPMPESASEPEADASFTRQPGVVCAVQAADCMPVLFCDVDGSVVAAAHAGWRGLAAGVLEATVTAMGVPAGRLMAWMGPAIGPEAFEVGEDVRAAFVGVDPAAGAAFAMHRPGKYLADLFQLARLRLRGAGVEAIYGGGLSTHADTRRFFSYRRDPRTGRMAALIWIA